ncbi:B12-binding domain-containing radical SAM protein [Anaerobutyricum hallii]|uniref:B12-binding domain-containing radical SAM protein n=1 Tax=Anaerobutyricum hallii TaxID=39488 RepID=UPI00242D32C0|nr:B12-binding domain-containing radical SAM protein [Anaerobutyricum hallii]
MRFLLCGINAKYIHSNLAIFSLKAYADRKKIPGAEIILKEYTINNYVEDILQDLYEEKADVVIFSCYIWNISFVRELAAELKKVSPDVKIWAGGPEVSYAANKFLMENPAFDLIMQGEGEEVFSELIRLTVEEKCRIKDVYKQSESKKVLSGIVEKRYSIEKKQAVKEEKDIEDKHFAGEDNVYPTNYIDMSKLQKLQGIAVWDFSGEAALGNAESNIGNKTKIINTGFATLMNMDTIPFVYEDFHLFEHKILYYETSRGCPFCCSYCLSSVDKTVRFRSLPIVKKELDAFLEAKVPQVKFVDRTFNCNRQRAIDIWSYLVEHDNGITNFHFEISSDLLGGEELELFAKMRPGLIQLEIGVQSTNGETVDAIHRHMDLDKLFHYVDRVHELGNIHQHLDLIAGLPYENYERFGCSFDDLYAHEPDQLQLGFLKVLKGTMMEEEVKKYSILYRNQPPYEVLGTKWLSYDEIILLKGVEELVELYYNSGQYTLTLKYAVPFFESSFRFYEMFSAWYRGKGYHKLNHNRLEKYNILREFLREHIDENEWDTLDEIMLYDMYLRENVKGRPAWAKDTAQYKKEWKALYREQGEKLFPEDVQAGIYDSKRAANQSHIEVFEINIKKFEQSGQVEKKQVFCLFDYSRRNPLNRAARTVEWEIL